MGDTFCRHCAFLVKYAATKQLAIAKIIFSVSLWPVVPSFPITNELKVVMSI